MRYSARYSRADMLRQLLEGDGLTEEADALGLLVVRLGLVEDDLAAGRLELEGDVEPAVEGVEDGLVAVGLDEQQQEPPAAGPGQLAAQRPRLKRPLVQLVHLGV